MNTHYTINSESKCVVFGPCIFLADQKLVRAVERLFSCGKVLESYGAGDYQAQVKDAADTGMPPEYESLSKEEFEEMEKVENVKTQIIGIRS